MDLFDIQITSFGPCFEAPIEYILEFYRGVEVVQKTRVVYGSCTDYKVTNWKAYENLENHLNRIFKYNRLLLK
jgi:hypothetical protein